jgi:hypothetical protein
MRSLSVAKLSVSIPRALEKAVRKRVGTRGVSGFTARALQHELERVELGEYLAELEDALGPVPSATLKKARSAWRKS